MSDERTRRLERRVAQGDSDAQHLLDAEQIRLCDHEPQTYITIDSIAFGIEITTWCKNCGFCMSDPTRDPRPEALRAEKEFNDGLIFSDGIVGEIDLSVEGLGLPVDLE